MANTIQTIQKTREYLDYVERHILNVNKAWEELNIKCRLKGFNWIYDDLSGSKKPDFLFLYL